MHFLKSYVLTLLCFSSVLSLCDLPILNVNIPFCGASVIGLYTQRITELAVQRKKLGTGD